MDFFESMISCTSYLCLVLVAGRAYGKKSPTTDADNLRAILPLPAVLQVLDVLLARLFTLYIDKALPPLDGTFVGARPLTQTFDISHGLQFVIEKYLHDKSQGGLAQMDVEKC